ncbi:uncharacterized protein LOC111713173 [Eurytemora carolleeae]|uniref:uncharacterized protein LOC111713173 n=1 Tax=Eurytemora carolleeae TaxID=1294199 RepID=UPI000C7580D2|nr:uncharacterized protein LOC111713173 [Eurytemora carolleeae]|eukprot:XP_023343759.1 uncharacterized protein LOC111713173 [Eurytemora affinis]
MGCCFENDDTIKPKTYIEHVFNFSVGRCIIRLKPVFVWTVTGFSVCVETRPSALAYTVATRTEDMHISTEYGDRILATSNLLYNTDPGWPNVFSFVFEKNPLVTNTDYRLEMRLLPLHVFYQEIVGSELLDFFFLPNTDSLEVTWGVIYQSYLYARQFSRFVQNCLNSRMTCDLKVDLHNPCIEIGQMGTISTDANKLVIHCGHLQLSCVRSEKQCENDHTGCSTNLSGCENGFTRCEEHVRIISRIECLVTGMAVILAPGAKSFPVLTQDPSSEYHLVPNTKAELTLSSVSPQQPWVLDIFIKCVKLNLSDKRVGEIIDFLRDLPLPQRAVLPNLDTPIRWKIDKRWTVPNIGKLELLYLETQLSTQQQEQQQHEKQQQHKQSFKNHDNKDVQKRSRSRKVAPPGSGLVDPGVDISGYCAAVDLPGLEDNISPGNPMRALLKLSVKDLSLVFGKETENVTRSYLNLAVMDYSLDVGILQYGPAVQVNDCILAMIQILDLHLCMLSN